MWMNWMGTFNADERLLTETAVVVKLVIPTENKQQITQNILCFRNFWFLSINFCLSKYMNNKSFDKQLVLNTLNELHIMNRMVCVWALGKKRMHMSLLIRQALSAFHSENDEQLNAKVPNRQKSSRNELKMSLMINFILFVWLFWSFAGVFHVLCYVW